MAQQDYYDLLGVERGADAAAIKSAFRKAAMKYHPDRNKDDPQAEVKFKEIGEAYEVLSDDQKRAAYDRFGHAAFQNGGMNGAGRGFGGAAGAGAFSDIFEDIFGEFMGGQARGRRGGPGRGADLKYNLRISLEEAFNGKAAEITVPGLSDLRDLRGLGRKSGLRSHSLRGLQGRGPRAHAAGVLHD